MPPLLREMFPGKLMLAVEDVARLGRLGAGGLRTDARATRERCHRAGLEEDGRPVVGADRRLGGRPR